jgi:hypothetical protein
MSSTTNGKSPSGEKWTSVHEALPEKKTRVIVAAWRRGRKEKRNVFEATHEGDGTFKKEGSGFPVTKDRIEAPIYHRVTHWIRVQGPLEKKDYPDPPEAIGGYPERSESGRETRKIERRTSNLG